MEKNTIAPQRLKLLDLRYCRKMRYVSGAVRRCSVSFWTDIYIYASLNKTEHVLTRSYMNKMELFHSIKALKRATVNIVSAQQTDKIQAYSTFLEIG